MAQDLGGIEINADNTETVLNAITAALNRSLTKIGMAAEGYAKLECPVDTGRLRNSITHEVVPSEKAVYIGTNVEYAPYVELGTSRQKAHPYLRPAAHNHGQEYRAILRSSFLGL